MIHEVSNRCENAPMVKKKVKWGRKPIVINRDIPVFEGPIITELATGINPTTPDIEEQRKTSVLFIGVKCMESDPVLDDTIGELTSNRLAVWIPNEGENHKVFTQSFGDCVGTYAVKTVSLI